MTNTIFETTDICLAAYLLTKAHKITKIDKLGNKGTFFFKDVDPSEITDFDTGQGLVEPQQFHQSIRQLTTACRRA